MLGRRFGSKLPAPAKIKAASVSSRTCTMLAERGSCGIIRGQWNGPRHGAKPRMRITAAASASTISPSIAKISTISCSNSTVPASESASKVTRVLCDHAVGVGARRTVSQGDAASREEGARGFRRTPGPLSSKRCGLNTNSLLCAAAKRASVQSLATSTRYSIVAPRGGVPLLPVTRRLDYHGEVTMSSRPRIAGRSPHGSSDGGVMTVSVLTIDATLPLAAALANGRDAEPVAGSCERRLGSFA